MFLLLFCSYSARKLHFSEIQLVCYRRTNGPMDGRTDTLSYGDAKTHLERSGCWRGNGRGKMEKGGEDGGERQKEGEGLKVGQEENGEGQEAA